MASQLTPMGNPDARKRMKRVGRAVWRASEWADHVISIRERLRQFGIVRLLVSLLSGRRAATVRVRVDLTGAESLDSDLFGKSRIRCPRCGTNLAETWIDGWLHS